MDFKRQRHFVQLQPQQPRAFPTPEAILVEAESRRQSLNLSEQAAAHARLKYSTNGGYAHRPSLQQVHLSPIIANTELKSPSPSPSPLSSTTATLQSELESPLAKLRIAAETAAMISIIEHTREGCEAGRRVRASLEQKFEQIGRNAAAQALRTSRAEDPELIIPELVAINEREAAERRAAELGRKNLSEARRLLDSLPAVLELPPAAVAEPSDLSDWHLQASRLRDARSALYGLSVRSGLTDEDLSEARRHAADFSEAVRLAGEVAERIAAAADAAAADATDASTTVEAEVANLPEEQQQQSEHRSRIRAQHQTSRFSTSASGSSADAAGVVPSVFAAPAAAGSAPSTGFFAPATAGSVPSSGFSAPATAGSAPSTGFSAPAAAGSAPSSVFSAPATAGSAPSSGFSAPATAGSVPSSVFSAPATAGSAPSSVFSASATAGSAPSSVFSAPATAGSAPSSVFSASATAGSAPSSVFSAPATSGSAPSSGFSGPAPTGSASSAANSGKVDALKESSRRWLKCRQYLADLRAKLDGLITGSTPELLQFKIDIETTLQNRLAQFCASVDPAQIKQRQQQTYLLLNIFTKESFVSFYQKRKISSITSVPNGEQFTMYTYCHCLLLQAEDQFSEPAKLRPDEEGADHLFCLRIAQSLAMASAMLCYFCKSFQPILLNFLLAECPLLLPHPPPPDWESDRSPDERVMRCRSLGRLYAALFCAPQLLGKFAKPKEFTLNHVWTLAAKLIGLSASGKHSHLLTCATLHSLLEMAGASMWRCYGRQFVKLLRTALRLYDREAFYTDSSAVLLVQFLEFSISSGCIADLGAGEAAAELFS